MESNCVAEGCVRREERGKWVEKMQASIFWVINSPCYCRSINETHLPVVTVPNCPGPNHNSLKTPRRAGVPGNKIGTKKEDKSLETTMTVGGWLFTVKKISIQYWKFRRSVLRLPNDNTAKQQARRQRYYRCRPKQEKGRYKRRHGVQGLLVYPRLFHFLYYI